MEKVFDWKKLKESRINEIKHCEVEAPQEYHTGKARRYYPKLCFKKAMDYVFDLNEPVAYYVKLIHGQYDNDYFMCNHAWVEIPGGIVFDGVLQRFYDKKGYYKTLMAIKEVEYTSRDAIEMFCNYNHYGPWHKQ